MPPLLLVMLGGAIGAGARHLVGPRALALLGPDFPWGTLAVNLIGGLLMGAARRRLARAGGGEPGGCCSASACSAASPPSPPSPRHWCADRARRSSGSALGYVARVGDRLGRGAVRSASRLTRAAGMSDATRRPPVHRRRRRRRHPARPLVQAPSARHQLQHRLALGAHRAAARRRHARRRRATGSPRAR